VPHDPLLPVHTAWDLGIGDSTAVWFFQVSRKELRVIDHYEASGHGLPHYAAVLEARGYGYGTEYLPHDAQARQLGSGRTLWETLRELTGRNPRILPQQNVMDGINAARVSLASAWVDGGRCYDGLEALRAYRADYDERRKVFTDKPRHDWASHSADSFRYLAMAWREMQPEKPPPPPVDTWARAFARDSEPVADWRVA
jgi:phage terminase large subunit